MWSKIHSFPTCVAFSEQLHAHDCEDEDDDTEDESEVSESTNGFPHNGDEEVERRPGLGQLEHSQLGEDGGDQVGGGGQAGGGVGGQVGGGDQVGCGQAGAGDRDEDDSELEQFRAWGNLNSRPVQSGIRISQRIALNLEVE